MFNKSASSFESFVCGLCCLPFGLYMVRLYANDGLKYLLVS